MHFLAFMSKRIFAPYISKMINIFNVSLNDVILRIIKT